MIGIAVVFLVSTMVLMALSAVEGQRASVAIGSRADQRMLCMRGQSPSGVSRRGSATAIGETLKFLPLNPAP
jgi:hypothetical protein